MVDFHGIIFAYSASPELGELVKRRTAASLPFCGRYRLIDFALSSMTNAGIRDVGVIMQRDYQSLLDHLGSGKAWDMSRKNGGLRMLPPFGLPDYHKGQYSGTIEALNAVSSYIKDIPQQHIVLMRGNLCANLDLSEIMAQHLASGDSITAICSDSSPDWPHHRFILGEDGYVKQALYYANAGAGGVCSLCGYIIEKPVLLDMMEKCRVRNEHFFHVDALEAFIAAGGRVNTYIHKGYARTIRTVSDFYSANMDMLDGANRAMLFAPDRPVRTRSHEEVSTYYGEQARSVNSLVGDSCIIEGSVENCIIFSGCRIAEGAELKNCIIMRDTSVGAGSKLCCVISDKHTEISGGLTLNGSQKLPLIVPKSAKV